MSNRTRRPQPGPAPAPQRREAEGGGGILEQSMSWIRSRLGGGDREREAESDGPARPQRAPQADLSGYAPIVELLQQAGVGAAQLQAAANTKGQAAVEAAYISGPKAAVGDEGTLPAADLGSNGNGASRAYGLDYSQSSARLDPQRPQSMAEGADEDEAAISDVFQGHWQDLFGEEFGGLTLEQVRGAIGVAEALGFPAAVQQIRARMFKVNQHAVIRSFNVESSSRYRPGGGNTYCNIYAYDVVSALGGYIPRVWWYDRPLAQVQGGARVMHGDQRDAARAAGEDVSDVVVPSYGETVFEMNANGLVTWMEEHGAAFGWRQGTAQEGQDAANGGQLAVMLATGRGQSGHITVVTAEGFGATADRNAEGELETPLQSQAGAANENLGTGGDQWWENSRHTDGAAWIMTSTPNSSLVPRELMGR